MKIYSELKELGFFKWLNDVHELEDGGDANEYLDGLELDNIALTGVNSMAFRWFREKYHLIGGIEYIGGATPNTTWYDIYVVGHFNTNTSKMTMKYQPYEEAELACLKKLIEIVKNNNKWNQNSKAN